MGSRKSLGDELEGSADRAQRASVRGVRGDNRGRGRPTGPSAGTEVAKGYRILKIRGGHSQVVGYARVSTRDQELDSQIRELEKAGCCRIYSEKVSSIGFRPGWSALVGDVRKGDTVIVTRLDRIGRKLGEVVQSCELLGTDGVYVRALAQQIDTRSAQGRLLLPIWAALAETERELTRERTVAGLEAARARGRSLGRPSVITRERIALALAMRLQGHSTRKIGEAMGLGEGTVRKALELGADTQQPKQLRIEGA